MSEGVRPAATAASWMRRPVTADAGLVSSGAQRQLHVGVVPGERQAPRPDPPGDTMAGSPSVNGTAFSGPIEAVVLAAVAGGIPVSFPPSA